jgi:hypothetical protein
VKESQRACTIGERRNAITIAAKQRQARSANRDILKTGNDDIDISNDTDIRKQYG